MVEYLNKIRALSLPEDIAAWHGFCKAHPSEKLRSIGMHTRSRTLDCCPVSTKLFLGFRVNFGTSRQTTPISSKRIMLGLTATQQSTSGHWKPSNVHEHWTSPLLHQLPLRTPRASIAIPITPRLTVPNEQSLAELTMLDDVLSIMT